MTFEVTGESGRGFRIDLQDERGHEIVVDLPRDEDGTDAGTSALELTLVSLAGCIGTIFRRVADRRRFTIDGYSIHLIAERGEGAPTIERVTGTFTVRTAADESELAIALRLTLRICPVGVIFERAGIPVHVRPVREPPSSLLAPTPASAIAVPIGRPPAA